MINTAAPKLEINSSFMQKFSKHITMPFEIFSPKWILEIGLVIIKTEAELIFKSSWIVRERLLHAGFLFKYNNIDEMLCEILKK